MQEEQKDVKCGVDSKLQPARLALTFVAILLKVSCIPVCRTSQCQKIKEAFKCLQLFFFLIAAREDQAYCLLLIHTFALVELSIPWLLVE